MEDIANDENEDVTKTVERIKKAQEKIKYQAFENK